MPAGSTLASLLTLVVGSLAIPTNVEGPSAARAAIPEPVPCAGGSCWDPEPTTEPWQLQLQGKVDLSVSAPVYDIDIDTPAGVVEAIHAQGDVAVCYMSVGTYEPFRGDADEFPRRVRGKRLERFEEERWLDIRKLAVLRPIMEARFDRCAEKGFDAIDPDNVEGYANRSGFKLTRRDQLTYNAWVANAIHERGMAVGLKNDLGQADRLLPYFDFAVNEQCFQYQECGVLDPFIDSGKPVYGVEYRVGRKRFCERSIAHGFSTIKKRFGLKAFRKSCPAAP
jgi:hypothetical protein